jgi:hypothetical protein
LGVWTFFPSFIVMTLLSWYSLFALLINILPHKQNWWWNMIINTMKYSIKLSMFQGEGFSYLKICSLSACSFDWYWFVLREKYC